MEGELYRALYQWTYRIAGRMPRTPRVQHSDQHIVMTYFWAVLHDRPMSWACDPRRWPVTIGRSWRPPSAATLSRRLRSTPIRRLLGALEQALDGGPSRMTLLKCIDSKPLIVGRTSRDRDATLGYGGGGMARGYKLHQVIDQQQHAHAWSVLPMNVHDATAARDLLPKLAGGQGYVVGDNAYDKSPLYDLAHAAGHQLIAPPQTTHRHVGYGRHAKSPHRRRSLDILAGEFGRTLLNDRKQIERHFGQLVTGPCGLIGLPPWVRGLQRVTRWVQAKLIIRSLRRKLQHA